MYSLGLALSGGGSKGIAHAGVLKFLAENNIEPEVLAGTSAGAIVATLYAAGKSPEENCEFFQVGLFFQVDAFHFYEIGRNHSFRCF